MSERRREGFPSGLRRRDWRPRSSCTGQRRQLKEHTEQARCIKRAVIMEIDLAMYLDNFFILLTFICKPETTSLMLHDNNVKFYFLK